MSYIVDIRRKIHEYPEIGFELPKTLALVKSELEKFGIPYTEKYGKSSVVATINEDKKDLTLAIRADMDALPIIEKTKAPYKSKIKGQMHACGHDAHTAILLDVARRLSEMKDKIDCRVKLVFQPAEEYNVPGASLMVKDGIMDDIDYMVALHVDPFFNVGSVAISAGATHATSNAFYIDFIGKSSHAARQESGVDAIAMAVKAYTAIEFMLAKELRFSKVCIFNVGSFHGGKTNNVICDNVRLFCTLRTHDNETENFVIKRIKEIVQYTAKSSGGKGKVLLGKRLPANVNDTLLAEKMKKSIEKVIGKENINDQPRSTGAEDFGYYGEKKPACIFRLGVRNEKKDCVYALHQDKFNLDEDALTIGSDIFVQFVLDNMQTLK